MIDKALGLRRHHARFPSTLALITLFLVVGEAALQARAHWKTGRSVFNAVGDKPTKVLHPIAQVPVYRPGAVIKGRDSVMMINSLGFRSPEIDPKPARNEIRVAVLGASSVAGAYTATNDGSFTQILGSQIAAAFPGRPVNVINSGIEGHTVSQTARLFNAVVRPLGPQIVILYPGFNDMGGLCRKKAGTEIPRLPTLDLPRWTLSRELIVKNTLWLREKPPKAANQKVAIDSESISNYRNNIETIITSAQASGAKMLLVTVARAFRKHMDPALQQELSETTRFYFPCLGLSELYEAGEAYNNEIRFLSRKHDIPLVELEQFLPGGKKYFVDGGHFSHEGEKEVASILFDALVKNKFFDTLTAASK